MNRTLRVGIIGASAERGWAKDAHVPAIQALEGVELAAVATRSQASADKAAKAFGASRGYADPLALCGDPGIDVVTVSVNVPAHRELVLRALAAGKHLFCEYPLGRNSNESAALAQAAERAGTHVVTGLQLRASPAAIRAAALVRDGAIGRVLHARILSTTAAFGPDVEPAMTFAEDEGNGVTLATIQGAHTLDLAVTVLGPLRDATALATTQFPQVRIGHEAGHASGHTRTTADHLLVQARLENGAPLSLEVAGGCPAADTPFRMVVTGERGTLALEGGAMRGVQSGRLSLSLDGLPLALDGGEATGLPDAAAHVAGLYAALRDDIRNNTRTATGFHHAAAVARMVEALLDAARTGRRVTADLGRAG